MADDAITFSFDDAAILVKLQQLSQIAQRQHAEIALQAGALPIQNAIKAKAPKETDTLGRSIHTEVVEKAGFIAAVKIGTNVIYAAIHEFGGIIKPKVAKLLHFVIGGEDIFAKVVHMPARPYMRPALDEQKTNAREATAAALSTILKSLL